MHTAMIGLGGMGRNMASRLPRGGHALVAYNRTPAKAEELKRDDGSAVAYSLQEDTFADRILAALRREFGGHGVAPSGRGNG